MPPVREKRMPEISDYKGLLKEQVALPVWPAHQPCRRPEKTSVRGPIVA